MKLIAFAGSNSLESINKKLVTYAASLFPDADKEVLDLNDFKMPLYHLDLENEVGLPDAINRFIGKIRSADILIVSLAENNNSFNAGFKNHFDWISRAEPKQFMGKPMLLMATSPGKRGGMNVLEHARVIFPRHGAEIKAVFSLPSFNENFRDGIVNTEYDTQLKTIIRDIQI